MNYRRVSRSIAVVASLTALGLAPARARAQVVGENVNMVSGIGWPGGDPFLQRQNEPTLAVSSVNPMHLMAGANDYRAVDIVVPAADLQKINGDAWLGVFKSLDGGQNWKSVLLPGYPQDPGCAIAAAPAPAGHVHHNRCGHNTASPSVGGMYALCGLPAAADPVMRAGTDGMMYLAGINFQRDKQKSRMFLARYIDLNNKENGDATTASDPLRYVDTRIIADNPPNVFIDKPWMAIDIPRAGAQTCEIPVSDDPAVPPRRFLGGTIYVAWAEFTLPDDQPTTTSTIKFTYSTDCGKSWVAPYAINSRNSVLNQGVALAVEPINGRVYATWRRIGTPTNKQTNAIMATRSGGRQRNFASPRVVANLTMPFEQGSSYTSFRTEAYPVMAISTDGTNSWAHVAWQQRKPSGMYESRIVMSSAQVHPPPSGDGDPDDPEELDSETRLKWSSPVMVDDHPTATGDDAGNVFASGHQVMPALTFGQGKLMLVYYDTRFDHARRYYAPLTAPTSDGRFYKEILAPLGELSPNANPKAPASSVFNAWLNDGSLGYVRHTVDVRVASAPAGGNPVFTSVLASKFPFGIRGDEGSFAKTGLSVPGFGTGTVEIVKAEATTAAGTSPAALKALQQLQMNPPNFPMFKNGGVAFMGDYIDIQGQAFVPNPKGGWSFNTARTAAPVFHAVWTSNQDVQVPRWLDSAGFPDWTQYAPPFCAGCNAPQASRYANDGGRTMAATCDPKKGAEASRDQNIYTARVTEGLLVATPQNMKPLDQTTRAFVIVAQNTTDKDMTVSFAASVPAQGATQTVPSLAYSFSSDSKAGAVTSLSGIVVPARSYVSRSLFVTLTDTTTNPLSTLNVTVTETGCTTCRSGYVTLNPPSALGALQQPDAAGSITDISLRDATGARMGDAGLTDPSAPAGGAGAPSWTNPGPMPSWTNTSNTDPSWTNPSWTNPSWTNPAVTNSNFVAPSWTNPSWTNPSWTNPSWTNPSWTNPSWTNPSWTNPSWTNPSWTNPSWTNPSWTNPSWTNPSWTNSSMSDLSYTITNTGNTTTSYHVRVVGESTASTPAIGLNLSKWYKTPASVGCKLIEVPRFLPVVEVPAMAITSPSSAVDPDPANGSATNATVSLAPGESALITLRANVTLEQMAELGSKIGVASVPSTFVPDGTTYQQLAGTQTTVGVGAGSTTTLTYDPTSAVATVTVSGSSGVPTGSIAVILNGRQMAARWALDGSGTATVAFSPAPQAGDTLAAYYPGSAVYKASTSGTIPVTPPVQLSVGVRAANSYVQIYLRDAVSGTMIDGAAVQFNGVAVLPMGNGYYYLEFNGTTVPWASGGMPIDIRITNTPGNVSAQVTGNYPAQPAITSPANHATILTTAPLTVSWTGTADYYDIIAYCDPLNSTNYVCPNGSQQVNGPATSYTYPAPVGWIAGTQAQVFVLAVNNLTFNGATQMGVSFAELPTMIYLEPVAGIWNASAASMATPRLGHGVASDGSASIWVAGGMKYTAPDAQGNVYLDYSSTIATVERYDLASATWSAEPTNGATPAIPFFPGWVQTGTGLYLFGGQAGASMSGVNSYEEYNWWSHDWTLYGGPSWPFMATARTMPAAAGSAGVLCQVYGNPNLNCLHVVVTGGYNVASALASTEITNGNGAWFAGAAMNRARYGHTAVMVGSRYFAIGGRDGSGAAIDDLEYADVYVDTSGVWHTTAWTTVSLTAGTGRWSASSAVLGGKIYVMGGIGNGSQVRPEVYVLDTATLAWSQGPSLAVPVSNAGATVLGTTVYVVGGDMGNPAGPTGRVQAYTP